MSELPVIGMQALRRMPSKDALSKFQVSYVRGVDDFIRISAIRSVCFIGEQKCPFDEEFDGNDLSASHLLAWVNGEPVATLRLRWFAGFGKVERVCILPSFRGTEILLVLLAYAFELAARKGYDTLIAQIQARLWPLWSKMLNCELRDEKSSLVFSDYEYLEIEIPLQAHPKAISKDADPYLLIRPEGDWDKPGVLDQSAIRSAQQDKAAQNE